MTTSLHNGNGHGIGAARAATTNGAGTDARTGWYSLLRPRPAGVTAEVAELLKDVTHNALTSRAEWFRQLSDPRRNVEDECGYPRLGDSIGPELYRQLYDREPIANRVCQVLPKESWQSPPTLYEDEGGDTATKFEAAWDALEVNLGSARTWHKEERGSSVWALLQKADVLSGIGHFGVILLGLDDGRDLQDPVDGAVLFNRRLEPVTQTVPVLAPDGRSLLLNADGRYRTARRQVGWRVVTDARAPLPPDTPADAEDARALDDMVANREVPYRQPHFERDGYREEVLSRPVKFLNGWRSRYEVPAGADDPWGGLDSTVDPVGNAESAWMPAPGPGRADDLPTHNAPPRPPRPPVDLGSAGAGAGAGSAPHAEGPALTARRPGQGADAPPTVIPQAGWGHGGNGPTTRAEDSAGGRPVSADAPVREMRLGQPHGAGTDRQFSWDPTGRLTAPPGAPQAAAGSAPPGPGGYAVPPGAGLAGTDQQYFGVQFGPAEQPAAEPTGRPRKLLFLRAFDESLVQVVRYEWNVLSPRFGHPVMYRIMLNDPRETHSGVGLPLATVFVHWTRVVHLNDDYQNPGASPIFSPPRQRPVLNRLLDLRKLYGASAEGYWKSCFAGISFETNPQLGGDVEVDEPAMKDALENYFNGLQRYLLGIGMTAKTLAPQVVDPSGQIAVQLEAVCIQLGVPVRVFKGSERGELASSQDDASWNDRLRSRQTYYITPRIIVPFVDRLIMLGVLPEPKQYSVEWPDLDSLTDKDKAGIFLQRVQALTAYIAGGGEQVLPPLDLLTRWAGMEEREALEVLTGAARAHEAADQQSQADQAQAEQDAADRQQAVQEQQQALADEHGFEPLPPPGFHDPEVTRLKAKAPTVPPPGGGGKGPPFGGGGGGKPPGPPAVKNRLTVMLDGLDEDGFESDGDPVENARRQPLTGGRWVTTDEGHHVYIKGGKAVAGNPRVLKKMGAEPAERKGSSPSVSSSKAQAPARQKLPPDGGPARTAAGVQLGAKVTEDEIAALPQFKDYAKAVAISAARKIELGSQQGLLLKDGDELSAIASYKEDRKEVYVGYLASARKGAGTEALAELAHLAGSKGKSLVLEGQAGARGFYEKMGMRALGDSATGNVGYEFTPQAAREFAAKHRTGSKGPPVTHARPDRTEQRLRDLLDNYTDEEKNGLAVWYNPRKQLVIVDRMDWYEKRGDADPATAVVELARDRVGFDQVEQQNEGGRPRPEDGWVTINAAAVDNAGANCGTGAGGFKPGNRCGKGGGEGDTITTRRGETLHRLEKGPDGRWQLPGGEPLPPHLKALALPPGYREAHGNLDPKGTVLARGVDAKGRVQSKYSDSHAAKQAAAKFGRVRELLKKREGIFRELDRDAKDPALKDRAECLKVVMKTGMRPGSDKDTGAEHPSYGATTLEGRHVIANRDGTVTLRLVTGKNKGREVDFPVRDPATARMLRDRAAAAGAGGKLFDTSAAELRLYSKGKDGGGFKTKDHRTALGTETAVDEVRGSDPPTSPRDYKAATKAVAQKVAATLGNTWNVALKSYIDPLVFAGWRKSAGV